MARAQSIGLVTNTANGQVNGQDQVNIINTPTNGYYQLEVDAGYSEYYHSGWINSGYRSNSWFNENHYIKKGSVNNTSITPSTATQTVRVTDGYYPSNVDITVSAMANATINTPSGSKQQSKPTFSINTTTGVVTASVAATNGTAYANVTSAGYTPKVDKSGNFQMTASSNTYPIPNGYVHTIGAINVLSDGGIKLSGNPQSSYKLSLRATSNSVTQTNGFVNTTYVKYDYDDYNYYINNQTISNTSITPYTNGTAQTVTVSEGYRDTDATITVAGVASATRSAGSASVLNNSNGNVRYYVNTTAGYTPANNQAYYLQLNTKAGATLMVGNSWTVVINAGQFAIGDINVKAGVGNLSVGYASVNNSNGNVTYYRNISTAGYIDKNTSPSYLQLNTKAGGTTPITGNTKIVNAGQFVTGDVYATVTAGVLGKDTASSTITSDGLVTNISNGAVNASDNIKTATGANSKYRIKAVGSGGANVTTAGYLTAGTKNNNSATSYIYVNKATASTTQPTASATAGTASVTLTNIASSSSATDYKIVATATGGSASTTAGSASVSEGYAPSATTASVSAKSNSGATNTQTVYLKKATSSVTNQTVTGTIAGTAASATTTITGMETTATNTGFIVSASASANSGKITGGSKTAYANITDGYSASAVSASAVASVSTVNAVTNSSSNTQYIKASTISDFSAKYKAQSTPTFSYNATTGVLTASVAKTTQAVYRNVTTGYVGTANTTGMTFTMNASSGTYNIISSIRGGFKSPIDGKGSVASGAVGSITR